jgi:hypothetical protein
MAAGNSFREVGRRFGLALGTVHRHKKHVRHGPVDAIAERSEAERSLAPFPRYTAAERFADPLGVLAAYQRWLLEARRRGVGPP